MEDASLTNFKNLLRRQEKWSGHKFHQEKCLWNISEINYVVIFLRSFKTNVFGDVCLCLCCSFTAATVIVLKLGMIWLFSCEHRELLLDHQDKGKKCGILEVDKSGSLDLT